MNNILKKDGKTLLLGNEAIVRGALESGVNFASTYPGTPASEIGDTFSKIAKETGIYFEYSTNEKTAFEAALGASLSGLKSFVSMKHFGLNVALDSFLPSVYINAPLVIAVSDDPNCWSSVQEEEDSRYISMLANVPLLEPSDSQECKEFTIESFKIAEQFSTPVMIRLTTRTSHNSGIVHLEPYNIQKRQGNFIKNESRFNTLSPRIIEMHTQVIEKLNKIKEYSEKSPLNKIFNDSSSDLAIITSGISFSYIMTILEENNLKIPLLKLGITYPLCEKKIISFLKIKKKILVIEELEPFLENAIKAIAQKNKINIEIYGKDVLPRAGEFNVGILKKALKKMGINLDYSENEKVKELINSLPKRFPILCAGCPHRTVFYAVKKTLPDAIYAGDIGCYLLGILPPLKALDFILDMGAGIGVAHGIKKSTTQKVVAFIGDSTFFHSGFAGLVNMVFNKSNALVMILDNRVTAMTGHQKNPSSVLDIEKIAKALGIKNVKTVDAYNFQELKKTIKKFSDSNELSVIIAKRECVFLKPRDSFKVKYEITEACKNCRICLEIGCPAIEFGEKIKINRSLCSGCALCAQICPNKAIKAAK